MSYIICIKLFNLYNLKKFSQERKVTFMAKKTEEKQNVAYTTLRLEQFTPTKLVNGVEVPEVDSDGNPRVVNCYLIYGTYLGKKTKFHMTTKDSSLKSDLADVKPAQTLTCIENREGELPYDYSKTHLNI